MVGKLGGWPDPFWDGDHLGRGSSRKDGFVSHHT
jgi:hypothetical protein